MTDTSQTSRRHILKGLGTIGALPSLTAVAASAGPLVAQAAPVTPSASALASSAPADFLTFSSTITGLSLDKSYLELSEKIWAALATTPKRADDFRRLITLTINAGNEWQKAIKDSGMLPYAQEAALIWYTGAVNFTSATGGEEVITYDSALAWRACSFTKPPANCGGPFGYWYNPA